jgi:hypothetical protein
MIDPAESSKEGYSSKKCCFDSDVGNNDESILA